MSLYEFSESDVYRFADSLRITKKRKGNELFFEYCPYCKSRKDKYTFSINIRTGQYHCKRASCGAKGNLITASKDFNFSLSDTADRYHNTNGYDERFRKFKDTHLESTESSIKYLKERGISEEITKKYEITIRNDSKSTLVFPFKDDQEHIQFIKYRNTEYVKGKTKGSKEWCEKNCKPILFGINHCIDFQTLVITEGQIDSLSLAEAGIKNAVSVPTGCNGFTWIPHCWDWIVKFKEIVIFGDCENGKITLVDELSRRFPNLIRVVRIADYRGCKDANEILIKFGKSALNEAVTKAEVIPLYYLKPLESVEHIRIEDIAYIPTGFHSIDEVLSGGLHEGELCILSGKRGGGKSTFASQILCSVTDLGYKSFVYSGELRDFVFRAWFDKQYFGIHEANNSYNGRVFLFDNNVISDDEHISIINAVEEAIKRYDVKFILLDNLMTIIDAESSDKLYRAQSEFVGKLIKIIKKYNVICVLVVHPRKNTSTDENDNVSGASEITNKADIVMTYSRDDNLIDSQRMLSISKNRLTGKLLKNQILYYDYSTKRISENDCFDWTYNFVEASNEESIMIEDTEEIPFIKN